MAAIEGLRLAQEFAAALPGSLEEILTLEFEGLLLLGTGGRVLGKVRRDDAPEPAPADGEERRARGAARGDERVIEIGHAAAAEIVAEAVPGLFGGGVQLAPVEKDVALVGVQFDGEAVLGKIRRSGADNRGR